MQRLDFKIKYHVPVEIQNFNGLLRFALAKQTTTQ